MGKIDGKKLVKMAKALNKLELTEDAVDVESKTDELSEDFISAIEEIDDAGEIDDVPGKIIKYYEKLLDEVDSGGKEDKPEKKKKKDKKKDKKKGKGKKKKEKKEEEVPAIDVDAIGEELEDKDYDELEEYCEENYPDFDFDFDEDDDDPEDDIIPAIMKYVKKLAKSSGKKEKKEKKPKKDKKEKKESKEKLPKGLRTGTLPAALYKAIEDGGATWGELAEVCAEEKDKEAEKCLGMAMRTVSRKVSKAVPVFAAFGGEDEDVQFTLGETADDDD